MYNISSCSAVRVESTMWCASIWVHMNLMHASYMADTLAAKIDISMKGFKLHSSITLDNIVERDMIYTMQMCIFC